MAEGKNRQQKRVVVSESREDLAAELAKYTAELSHEFSGLKGSFTVVLSGGYLIDCLSKLVEKPYVESVEWEKWHVFWVDERVVKKDHDDSNYLLALNGFLSKVPIPPSQVYAINDSLTPFTPESAADDYEACLKELVKKGVLETSTTSGFPKFDLMLLGMGPDGHIASLFPGHPLLKEHKKWVTFIEDSPKPPPYRITFTFPVINASSYIAMVVSGPGETKAVKKALEEQQDPSSLLPVQMIALENGEFTWFTDKEAVSELDIKTSQ